MHNAARMRERDSITNLLHGVQLRIQIRESIGRDRTFEVSAVEQLHGHEEAAGVFTEIMDDDDVGMRQSRGRLRLSTKSLPPFFISSGDDFQRDVAIENRIVRAKDFAHRTLADAVEDLVLANAFHWTVA